MYKVAYLPLTINDIKEIVKYIANELNVPRAAENLVSKIDKGVLKIADNPFRCHLYAPLEPENNKEERIRRALRYSPCSVREVK